MKKHFVRADVTPKESRVFRYPPQRRHRIGLQTRELNRRRVLATQPQKAAANG